MTCIVCQRIEAADGWTVCRGCLDRVDDDLARIVELTALAAGRLIPETRPGNGGRSVPGSRPPLSVDALDDCIGHDVLPVLEDWERAIRAHYGLTPYGVASAARNGSRTSDPITRMDTGGPGDASTSRGPDTATEER
jgi:hypothetical protein